MANGHVFPSSRTLCCWLFLCALWLILSPPKSITSFIATPSSIKTPSRPYSTTSYRKTRPLTKLVKHGFLYLGLCSNVTLLRCGDVSSNPGPQRSSKPSLNCFLQNVRSLKAATRGNGNQSYENKMAVLQDCAYSHDLDVICLTETWLNDSISTHEILPFGYNIYRKDRLNQVGGGVLIAIRDCYASSEYLYEASGFEVVLVDLVLKRSKKLLLINIYRPPNASDFIVKMHTLLTSLPLSSYSGVFIVGDFNYPGIRWIDGSGFATSANGDEQAFANLLLDFNFFQFVSTPTRNNNLLDLVFTNSSELILHVESGLNLMDIGLPSDHYPVTFDIAASLKFKNYGQRYRFDFSKANFDLINKNLSHLPLSSGVNNAKSQEDLDALWEIWNDLVFSTIDECVPKVKCRNPNYPPWISRDLAKAIKKKKTLWKRVRKSNDNNLKEKFRKERQRIKNWIRVERKRYFVDIANEAYSNPKKFWSLFSFKHRKKSIPDKVTYNGVDATDDRTKAEMFLRFFESVYTDHSSCTVSDNLVRNPAINDYLELIEVTTNEVTELLASLDCSKATGPDNLPSTVLKKCATSLAPSITTFINCSFANGYLPGNICKYLSGPQER